LRNEPSAADIFLAAVLGLTEYQFDARAAARLDYASYVLEFAQDQGYGPLRTLSLLSIANNLLQACVQGCSFVDAEATLKTQLIALCSPKPGLDTERFSPQQVARIGAFFARTFFRHYRLYAYCFSQEQDLTEYSAELLVETPLVPSFSGALPEVEWHAQLEQRQAEEVAAKQAAEEAEQARQEAERSERAAQEKAEAEAARQAELARKPATLEEAIERMVAIRLDQEKAVLAAEYRSKEGVLLQKITELEARAGPPLQAEPSGKKK